MSPRRWPAWPRVGGWSPSRARALPPTARRAAKRSRACRSAGGWCSRRRSTVAPTIVVDDGIATGGTVRAALQGLSRVRPADLVLAVPVAPADTLEWLRSQGAEVVCLIAPEPLYAISWHYEDFTQTSDQEVVALLNEAHTWSREVAQ